MRERNELRLYAHQQLMDEYNDLQIRIKIYLLDIDDEKLRRQYPKPSGEELDEMMMRIIRVLREESKPMIRY